MPTSQNGWPASPDKSAIGIVSPKVPGTNVDFPQGIRGGDVATVLLYVARQFHRTVEPLRDGWCWGYFYRRIEGSSSLSNHASGTAIDLNAPNHPLGASGTFRSAQVRAIRAILAYCGGVVRWGGDYSGRKDEMHFEISRGAADVARLAAKIREDDDMPYSIEQLRAAPWQYNGRGMPGVPAGRSTLWVLGTIYSTQQALLRVQAGDSADEIVAEIRAQGAQTLAAMASAHSAILAALPEGDGPVPREDLVAALTAVLGPVDDPTPSDLTGDPCD